MTPVVWTRAARRDLRSIYRYIAEDSVYHADLTAGRLTAAVTRLAEFPESGRVVPEYGEHIIREVILPPYRIMYRLAPERIEVLAVVHSSRLLREQ